MTQEQFEEAQNELDVFCAEMDREIEQAKDEWLGGSSFEASVRYSRLLMQYSARRAKKAYSLGI